MKSQDFYDDFIEDENEGLDFREQLRKYAIHWKWFLLTISIGLAGAFLHLRYTPSVYQASTSILVKDEKKGGMLSELSAFSDLGFGGNISNNVDNEIEILKSRTLIESTIQKLNLNVSLFVNETVVKSDVYKKAPIKIVFLNKSKLFYESKMTLKCHFLNENVFSLESIKDDETNSVLLGKKEFKYGEKIETEIGAFIIEKTSFFENKHTDEYEFVDIEITPLDDVTDKFRKNLKVEPVSKTSSIVNISISDPVAQKATDFLDTMIQIYNKDADEDRNIVSENTSNFIANRLVLISQELDGVEQNVESFKKNNQLTDIESEAKLFIDGSNEFNKKSVDAEIQLNVISSLLGFIAKSSTTDLLPTNIISDKGEASALMTSYNQLVLDRNRILKSATTENPTVVKLEHDISSLKSNIAESLKRMQSNLQIQARDLRGQESVLKSKIGKIPLQERQFRVIARQQKVKEELYLYLLKKREETAISLAATEPNARVIDFAKEEKNPISPKKKIIYLAGILLGLLVPFGIIYVDDLLDTKIKSKLDLEGKTQIPYVGDIPSSDDVESLIKFDDRSSSAEAFRIVRTNLEFMVNKDDEKTAKTIFVTSSFASEGKTFVSANLAATFAMSGKRVLLIGTDIRNPKFDRFVDFPNKGLTNYLTSNDKDIQGYIVKHRDYENFYILPPGVVPPNPAELLMNPKVEQLFENLKKEYDYIIADTAPACLVTDTIVIAKNADVFAYVMRANKLEKRMLSVVNSFYKEKKLPNMCIILNDTDSTKAYAYGYGYGIREEKKPWFRRFFS
ncbi:GumC family protein [Flavobacterium hungaricum]|uniref:non-specific protein-tyrosine kinase n=1 Tax=Flavobacterium hungaricum TaxID=2082725 RepID=A0ABR9TQK5_9FLAO|nr:polysaccharide biosynthesis tyrosine autokinase [Flavobacterium hungaricum]MBE8727044.1 tyrosine protein kinase [Flavobacterium hungaricum]